MGIKHPNCTTRASENPCTDAYCPIHGRIRDMDAGASPFIDPDAVAETQARLMGLSDDEVRETYRDANEAGEPAGTEFSQTLRREASEADARNEAAEMSVFDQHVGLENALNASFDALTQAAPSGCLCDYSQEPFGFDQSVKRHAVRGCPVHRLPLYDRLLLEAKIERDRGWVTTLEGSVHARPLHPCNGYRSTLKRPKDAEVQLMRESRDAVC